MGTPSFANGVILYGLLKILPSEAVSDSATDAASSQLMKGNTIFSNYVQTDILAPNQ